MTDHEQIANDEARHGNREALERMTEERDALIAAAYEAAANACDDYPRAAPEEAEWMRYDEAIEYNQSNIRALTPTDARAAFEALIAAAYEEGRREALTEWLPMDTAPKDGTWFVATEGGETYPCKWHEEYDEFYLRDGWFDLFNETFENPEAWHPTLLALHEKDFESDLAPVTLSAGGPGRMVDCWKCPDCGHSALIAQEEGGE